jgi:hypothetical protein
LSSPPSSISATFVRSHSAADSHGLHFLKLRLVAALFGSSVVLRHPREEAKRQALIDSVQAPFESIPWLAKGITRMVVLCHLGLLAPSKHFSN